MSKLRLDVSLAPQNKTFDTLDATYRDEGLSVNQNRMRFQGADVELEVKLEDITIGQRIGQGACSSVYRATHNLTQESYAVKMFNIYDRGQAGQLLKEINLLTSVDCDALISLKGVFHDEGMIGMIIEYMDCGSLVTLLKEETKMSERVFAAICFQVVWGLGYLHFDNRLHRDIKPANILMNSQGYVKLSDFGISKELDSTAAMSATSVGTFKYMSPERLLGLPYNQSADLWSLGITMIELWSKQHPFAYCATTPIDLVAEFEVFQFQSIVSNDVFSTTMQDFIQPLLSYHGCDRGDCDLLLKHTWFEQFTINNLDDAHAIVKQWAQDNNIHKQSFPGSGNNSGNNSNNNSNNNSFSGSFPHVQSQFLRATSPPTSSQQKLQQQEQDKKRRQEKREKALNGGNNNINNINNSHVNNNNNNNNNNGSRIGQGPVLSSLSLSPLSSSKKMMLPIRSVSGEAKRGEETKGTLDIDSNNNNSNNNNNNGRYDSPRLNNNNNNNNNNNRSRSQDGLGDFHVRSSLK